MSADPFANTIAVKNILQHVISPKIVNDGNGGYVTKTDLVNVHNLIFSMPTGTDDGAILPNTAQCGIVSLPGDGESGSIRVYHSRVTSNAIVFASYVSANAVNRQVSSVVCIDGSFLISTDAPGTGTIAWFIVRF
jgi:hypothetical protein